MSKFKKPCFDFILKDMQYNPDLIDECIEDIYHPEQCNHTEQGGRWGNCTNGKLSKFYKQWKKNDK